MFACLAGNMPQLSPSSPPRTIEEGAMSQGCQIDLGGYYIPILSGAPCTLHKRCQGQGHKGQKTGGLDAHRRVATNVS
jgi:hypothetical protein